MFVREYNDNFIQKMTFVVLCLAIMVSGAATLIHWNEPDPLLADIIIPPVSLVLFFFLLTALIFRPHWMFSIAKATYFVAFLALAVPSWIYTIQAYLDPSLQLVDLYPPISSLLFPMIIIAMIFFRPLNAFIITLTAWVFIAVPVVVYLLGHPLELWSSRGQDMLMAYGPTLLMVLVMIPFYQEMQGRIKTLSVKNHYIRGLAELDELTRLPNRRSGEYRLKQIINNKEPAGLLFFDIDHFKKINDNHGHAAGDKVLRVISDRCNNVLRKEGFLARWGGEEFLVILKDVNEDTILNIGDRLRSTICEGVIEPVGTVTASFGATLVHEMDTEMTLMDRVDQALYRAKATDRNCVVFEAID